MAPVEAAEAEKSTTTTAAFLTLSTADDALGVIFFFFPLTALWTPGRHQNNFGTYSALIEVSLEENENLLECIQVSEDVVASVKEILGNFRSHLAGHILLRMEYYIWKHLRGESIAIWLCYAHSIIMFII